VRGGGGEERGLTIDGLGESLLPLGGFQYLEGAHEGVVDAHHGAGIVELSAVVGGREDRHELTASEEFVAIFDHLMGATDEVQVMPSQELSHDIFAKSKRDAAIVLSPANNVFVGIGPQEVAQKTCVWDVGGSHDPLHLLHVLKLGAEATVHAEDLFIDNSSHREAVKGVSEGLPELDVVSALACGGVSREGGRETYIHHRSHRCG
jgi:hypothetical protein